MLDAAQYLHEGHGFAHLGQPGLVRLLGGFDRCLAPLGEPMFGDVRDGSLRPDGLDRRDAQLRTLFNEPILSRTLGRCDSEGQLWTSTRAMVDARDLHLD